MREFLTNNEIEKKYEELSKATVKCRCGHSVTITNRHKRKICSWCGNFVYLDPKEQFKAKMKELLNK